MKSIRTAVALSTAAAFILPLPAEAGPTVKKRAWQTIGFSLESARAAWGPGYGDRLVSLPRCPAGEAFVVTALRVAPSRARLQSALSWSADRLAAVGAWQVVLGTHGPDDTYLAVPLNGAGGVDAQAEFAGGLTGYPVGNGEQGVSLTATFKPLGPAAPDAPVVGGLRF